MATHPNRAAKIAATVPTGASEAGGGMLSGPSEAGFRSDQQST